MFDPEDMVPRQTLDDATAGVERLKQKLDEANVQNKKEMETALKSMQWQLRTYVISAHPCRGPGSFARLATLFPPERVCVSVFSP